MADYTDQYLEYLQGPKHRQRMIELLEKKVKPGVPISFSHARLDHPDVTRKALLGAIQFLHDEKDKRDKCKNRREQLAAIGIPTKGTEDE